MHQAPSALSSAGDAPGATTICKGADDCASKVCVDGECKAAAPDDGVKSDDETGKPAGNGPNGHADLGGLLFNITSSFDANGNSRWSRSGSWENHAIPYGAHVSPKARAYWAAGGHCTRY